MPLPRLPVLGWETMAPEAGSRDESGRHFQSAAFRLSIGRRLAFNWSELFGGTDGHPRPRRLAGACGDRFALGLVLYDHDKAVPFGERLFAVPVSTLWR